jgi:hypothetical protein
MTTSFNMTRTQIAQRVLGRVIKIGATTASTADADTVYQALDLRLKEMHKRGIFWRKVTTVPVTFSLSSSIATASAGAGDILFPLKMTFTNGDNDDPIMIVGPTDYAAIEDKSRTGNPEKALWKGGSEFIFYPIPSANGTAKLLYEKIADDTSAGAAIDIDVSMIRPMMDLVKYDIADDYGVPEQTIMRWAAEAKQAEIDIRRLTALRTETDEVMVDDFEATRRLETDYGWAR